MKHLRLLLGLVFIGACMPLSACNQKVDYVSKCHLDSSLSYEGKNFLDSGIGEVTVKKYVDGDTTHFNQKETLGRLVKTRYMGVDTPESTGQIEPWGKAASNFTKKTLENAKTIVLTSDLPDIGGAAQVDSTGSRFKAFVWFSEKENAPINKLKCLNLLLVQEGYSTGKSIAGSPLADYFTKADLQAQKLKLHIWSTKPDPDYYVGPATETTLKELAETFNEDGSESSFIGAKVAFEGIVYKISGTYDAYLFDTDENGNKYGIYVFAGYHSYEPLLTLGNRIRVVGNYTQFAGNPQVTNVSYDAFLPGEDDIKVISTGNTYEFDTKTVEEISSREHLNMIYQLNNLTCYKGKTEIDQQTKKPSGALTLRCKDAQDKEISVRIPEDVFVREDPNGQTDPRVTDATYFEGKTINVLGAINFFAPDENKPDDGYYQIRLCKTEDFTYVH